MFFSFFRAASPTVVLFGGEPKGESAIHYKDQVGNRIRHTYEVFNNGPATVDNLQVLIEWPFQVANNKRLGKWLLYMDEKPTVDGNYS